MKTRTWDVYFDTGVAVKLPEGVDPESDDGYRMLKTAAKERLLQAIESDSFDINFEEYLED